MTARREFVSQYFTGIDRNAFRHVIGHFTSGVAVITCRNHGEHAGMTASAVSSVSLDPPMVLVCLNQSTSTQRAVQAAGAFAINVLHQDQAELAQRFASIGTHDKFEDVEITYGVLGQPLLDDALATLECEVEAGVSAATHRIFVANVIHANARPGEPLAYFRGQFGRLLRAQQSGTDDLTGATIDARATIMLGAAERISVAITEFTAAQLRRRLDDATAAVEAGAEPARMLRRDAEFHDQLVALADNPALLESFSRLAVPENGRDPGPEEAGQLIAQDRYILEALTTGDMEATRAALAAHTALRQELARS